MKFFVAFDDTGEVFDGYVQAKDADEALIKARRRWGNTVFRVELFEGVL